MTEHEMWEWDRQTDILKANGFTTAEIMPIIKEIK